MLIAEDLLLLLLDDETGKASKGQELPPALGGALLVELAMLGAVELEPKQGLFGSAKVHAETGPALEDPLLAHALAVVQDKPRRAQSVVEKLGKGAKETLADRLVERGVLERREDRVLGLFPRTTWPTKDAGHEQQLRATLTAVLTTEQPPDERTAALVSLLSAIDHAHKVVDHPGLSNREVKKRAKQIAEGDWASKAVKDSVQAAQAATTAAIVAVTATTTAGTN
ncbi:GPP34 family phosphoprotein [Nocardioides mangrovicus]|uniref:GPP34 family phosphoprotein n=1 Tax=Nocardioides mangrovicus TaxID=2478913 RepID=A0A3L8NXG2_9ACTN|nr:GPP34 family phosphoprotein [Nocardioides mangrovicus]RLV47840.1 GPP34 family phosphoprotein [Nocardioides mangrovicus]